MRFPTAFVCAVSFSALALIVSFTGPATAGLATSSVVALTNPPIVHTPPPDPIGIHSSAPTVTSVALASNDGTNVQCPATIHVTAYVAGTKGKYLHVVVRAFFNGQFVTVDGTQSLPDDIMLADGTYSRTFPIALPVLGGEQGDGVQLTAWQDGDTFPFTTPSTNAQFIPTCKAPPTPAPSPTPVPTLAPGADLGIPTDLTAVHSAQTCQGLVLASVVGSGCASAVQKGDLVLAWSYKSLSHCEPHCATPSGYAVERAGYEGGAFTPYQLVNYDPATPEADGIIMSVPYATTFGQCYRVLALRGSIDLGVPSTPVCIKPDAVTLNASGFYFSHRLEHWKSGALCSPDSNQGGIALLTNRPANEFMVGYMNRETFSSALQCEEQYYDRFQSDVVFPISSLPLKKIAHATFTATVVNGASNPGDPGLGDGSERAEQIDCVANVGFPTNFKPGGSMPETITFDNYRDLSSGNTASTVSIDVTGMVQAWLRPGGINNGLVLSAPVFHGITDGVNFTDLPNAWNNECLTMFTNPQIVVTY